MDSDLDLHLDEVPNQNQQRISSTWKKSWENTLSRSSHKDASINLWNLAFYALFITLLLFSCVGPISHNISEVKFVPEEITLPIVVTCPIQPPIAIPIQKCPVTMQYVNVPQPYIPDDAEIQRREHQERLLRQLEINVSNALSTIQHQKTDLIKASEQSNQLLAQLTASKAYQHELEMKLKSYHNISQMVQELQTRWLQHAPAIKELDSHFIALVNSTTAVASSLDVAKHLHRQNEVLASKLDQSVSHTIGLHASYSSRLSTVEDHLKSVSHTCDEGYITAKVAAKLEALVQNETYHRITHNNNDRQPVISNKSSASLSWVDYASVRLGGQVVTTMTSPTYFPIHTHEHTFKYFTALNLPINSMIPALNRFYNFIGVDIGVGKPMDALSEDMTIGSCWPLQGSNGIITVKLNTPIHVTSITIDHVPKSHSMDYRSAVAKFRVMASTSVSGPYKPLLSGVYSMSDGVSATQTFLVDANVVDEPLQYVSLNIISNHGHPEYTCLYRFRVHGKPHAQ